MKRKVFVLSLLLMLGVGCISCASVAERPTDRSGGGSPGSVEASAHDLIPYVEAQQTAHVRESTGVYAYQCFTDDDLSRFKANSVHLKVARAARLSPRFRVIVVRLKALPEPQRNAILAEARDVGHHTWAQLGRITTDGSGQTEAGQAAERLIARAIVRSAEEMIAEAESLTDWSRGFGGAFLRIIGACLSSRSTRRVVGSSPSRGKTWAQPSTDG